MRLVLSGIVATTVLALFSGALAAQPRTDTPLAPSSASASAEAAAIIQRYLARQDPDLTRYRANRRLEASARGGRVRGWLDARTELDERGFRYEVLSEGGNGIIRGRVLKAALEAEATMRRSKDDRGAAITPANYDFTGASVIDEHHARIYIRPKRRDVTLIDGSLVVTRKDADLVRVEGMLAKRPSFWTRRVRVVRRYGRIDGDHVPLSMESTADVLVVGQSAFSMRYHYESIGGRPVSAADDHAAHQRAGTPAGPVLETEPAGPTESESPASAQPAPATPPKKEC